MITLSGDDQLKTQLKEISVWKYRVVKYLNHSEKMADSKTTSGIRIALTREQT